MQDEQVKENVAPEEYIEIKADDSVEDIGIIKEFMKFKKSAEAQLKDIQGRLANIEKELPKINVDTLAQANEMLSTVQKDILDKATTMCFNMNTEFYQSQTAEINEKLFERIKLKMGSWILTNLKTKMRGVQ